MRFFEFVQDYRIPYVIGGHKHAQDGWINMPCPFCTGSSGYHLGYNLEANFFTCWRCGYHKMEDALQALTKQAKPAIHAILAKYDGASLRIRREAPKYATTCKLPVGCSPLQKEHCEYLQNRNFDAKLLEKTWSLKGSGNFGPFADRIIAPIFVDGCLMSYQGRDITGKSSLRYKACKKEFEAMPHKHLLYGMDLAKQESVLIVEGIADAWRLGPGAVATFGIKFTQQQVNLLSQWKNRFILFDNDSKKINAAANKQANALFSLLSVFAGHTELLCLPADVKDPGDLSDAVAKEIMDYYIGC